MGRLVATCVSLALSLSACSGAPDSRDRTPSNDADNSPNQPAQSANAWGVLNNRRPCEQDEFKSPALPSGVVAWAPVDACRVVLVGDFGVALATSGRLSTLSKRIGALREISGVAVSHDVIWVSGMIGNARPRVAILRVDSMQSKLLRPAPSADYATGIARYRDGVLIAVGDNDPTNVTALWINDVATQQIGAWPVSPGLVAIASDSIAGTTSGMTTDRVFGGTPASLMLGPMLPSRAGGGTASAYGRHQLVGVNIIGPSGAATSVRYYLSRNRGHTWSSSRPAGIIEVGSSAISSSGEIFSSMTNRSGNSQVFRSRDAETWRAVEDVELGESSARLAAADGVVWLLMDGRLLPLD